MLAPLHKNEIARLTALRDTGVLDGSSERFHDAVVRLASQLCEVPIAAISLVDRDRQWFLASRGLDCKQTPRDISFCSHTILSDDAFIVNDAANDERFHDNALVTGSPNIRFYTGIPLTVGGDLPLGSLCVIDTQPRALTPEQFSGLKLLAELLSAELDIRLRGNVYSRQQRCTQMLMDFATDYCMLTFDADGYITSWNTGAQRIKGYSESEALGRHYSTFFSQHDRDEQVPQAMLARAASVGSCDVCGWRIKRDGSTFHVAGVLRAVHDASGKAVGFVKVTRDDTAQYQLTQELFARSQELSAANQRLAEQTVVLRAQALELEAAKSAALQASRSKSEFLANMSHEIRTPMTAILGYTDLLAEGAAPGKQAEHIDTIKRNGEHLLSLINDILDLSRIEAGKLIIEPLLVDVHAILEDVHELMSVRAAANRIPLTLNIEHSLPRVIRTDSLRLRQMLVNIINNAVKFTDIGAVSVRAWATRSDNLLTLHISIVDTGIGMDGEQLSRIFGMFEQADASTTRRYGGSGLGLRISKMIANLLGGDIAATSTPGIGSAFTITVNAGDIRELPNAETLVSSPQITTPQHNTTTAQPSAVSLSGVRIFLAEDGIDNQRLITHHLRNAGAEVRVFDNGATALASLQQHNSDCWPCDLLVTDIQMPEMDGYTLARTLRTMNCPLPIIALTANAMDGDREKCIEAGCSGYLSKPINKARLVAACAAAVDAPTPQPSS